jgi:glucosamine 6-phosphate synthetase-like amidotransferase/phosphosugar isomerase protein
MLKEIYEQPRSVADCMRGRVNADSGHLVLGGLRDYIDKLAKTKRIVIVACGTSWHAGLVGEYIFEELARINVEVEYASEFRYRNPIIKEGDFVIAISQSGETADTLAAIELAKSKGATIIGSGPESLKQVSMIGNDLKLDSGVGVCGKEGQSVPVGVGQPTLRIDSLTVGGTA